MMTSYRPRPALAAALLAAALLGSPCQAMTSSNPAATHAHLQQGVVEQTGSVLRISGRTYAFSASSAAIYDRKGAPVDAARLAVGKTVAFSVVTSGSQSRIEQLWIIE